MEKTHTETSLKYLQISSKYIRKMYDFKQDTKINHKKHYNIQGKKIYREISHYRNTHLGKYGLDENSSFPVAI